mmetsp:Transcript_33675/g.24703  ORF Transcript_33675/g.24703 Transcript_33675/m.24703 type:complete len:180 (-) Transcript_33675:34-573(-)
MCSEVLTLFLVYPYELIKVRFMTKNNFYGYENVFHAFRKIVSKDGFTGLYRGMFSFFVTYLCQYTIQMTVYEMTIDYFKHKLGLQEFNNRENISIIQASLISGAFASVLLNFLEVIVIRKQAETGENVRDIFRTQGFKIFTKGLGAKVILTCGYSTIFFMSMNRFGKLFGVNLTEDKEE